MGAAARDGEIENLRRDISAFYQDLILHRPYTPTEDDLGEGQAAAWTDGEEMPCSFHPESSDERMDDDKRVVITDARVRLPLSRLGEVKSTDQIVLLKRRKVDVDPPLVFQVIGEADIYQTSLLFDLQRVTL